MKQHTQTTGEIPITKTEVVFNTELRGAIVTVSGYSSESEREFKEDEIFLVSSVDWDRLEVIDRLGKRETVFLSELNQEDPLGFRVRRLAD